MFSDELDLIALPQPDLWALDAALTFVGLLITVTAMKGFITDLASIPRPLRGLLDVNGRSRRPAAIHDWLYAMQMISRAQADELLRQMLISEGMSPAGARTYWLGVRAGGWLSWRKDSQVATSSRFTAPIYYRAWLDSLQDKPHDHN